MLFGRGSRPACALQCRMNRKNQQRMRAPPVRRITIGPGSGRRVVAREGTVVRHRCFAPSRALLHFSRRPGFLASSCGSPVSEPSAPNVDLTMIDHPSTIGRWPAIGRAHDASVGNDRGDQFGWRDVEGRVPHRSAIGDHRGPERPRHLVGRSLLDDDRVA